ncbi:hypothetical protein ANN_17627 [Periplaneta americana]|uniref:Uncharacterized protein n=1 Tax=Periplaneta americana TaxID=6978 RepID=A0ABQ8SU12_PERAM|nr:hypothetical protein ANN_17627 [Periplaneta americana]
MYRKECASATIAPPGHQLGGIYLNSDAVEGMVKRRRVRLYSRRQNLDYQFLCKVINGDID